MTVRGIAGTEVEEVDGALGQPPWQSSDGPPVPVAIRGQVWDEIVAATDGAADPRGAPVVFRLFMARGRPREVIALTRIESVWRTARGILRWNEGGYPRLTEPTRKGGNAVIRGDVDLRPDDAWWMGREQTDLRLLLRRMGEDIIEVGAWWARGGTGGLGAGHETDGEFMPVRLLIERIGSDAGSSAGGSPHPETDEGPAHRS
jgi:hypothetical protein